MTFLREKPAISRAVPRCVVPGGRVTFMGSGFSGRIGNTAELLMNGVPAHIISVSSKSMTALVPDGVSGESPQMSLGGEPLPRVELQIAYLIGDELHPVDNPVLDVSGNIYTTFSGARGEKSPVSVFRIRPDGTRENYLTDITNSTSLAIGPGGDLFISSRFNGTVYRSTHSGDVSTYVEGLGTATGIAFDREWNLYVGDRTGTIYRVRPDRSIEEWCTLPSSIAFFHLCFGPDGALYVTNPDISTYDAVLRISPDSRDAQVFYPGVKRPQGMAFDEEGNLYVAKAMAGDSGILRISPDGKASMTVSGPVIIGLAFDATGRMIVATTNALYGLQLGVRGYRVH